MSIKHVCSSILCAELHTYEVVNLIIRFPSYMLFTLYHCYLSTRLLYVFSRVLSKDAMRVVPLTTHKRAHLRNSYQFSASITTFFQSPQIIVSQNRKSLKLNEDTFTDWALQSVA